VSGIAKRFLFALSLLLVLAAFTGMAAAAMPEMAETVAEEAEQMETEGEVLPDFTPLSPPKTPQPRTAELSARAFNTHDYFRTGIFPEILTPPPL